MGRLAKNNINNNILLEKEENFCKLFVKYGNGYKAFMEAFPEYKNWSRNSIDNKVYRLQKNERIKQRIEQIKEIKNNAIAKSTKLNHKKLIETALKALNECNTPAERQHFVSILKMLFQKEGMLSENNNNIQVNINNAPVMNEITNYLDI